jgi:hypothetical protein
LSKAVLYEFIVNTALAVSPDDVVCNQSDLHISPR